MEKQKFATLILRIGLAFSLVFAGVSALITSSDWIGYYPEFVRNFSFSEVLVMISSVGEIFIGLWILSGWKVFLPSVATALFMASIVIFNFGAFLIVFRDVTIGFAAVALAILNREK